MMDIDKLSAVIGVVGGLISTALGGFDLSIKCLLLVMILDIGSGITAAAVFKKSKYNNGGLSSDALFKGSIRKISMLAIISIGVMVDKVMGIDYVRNAVVMYFIATDGLSVIENMSKIGVPIPSFLQKLMESMEEKNDKGGMST